MYLLAKDYTSGDDKWIVGFYNDQGTWVDAPLVAGHTAPSYDFQTASDHLTNMNAELERKQVEAERANKQRDQQEHAAPGAAKTALMIIVFAFLFVIFLRIFAAALMLILPLMAIFAGLAILLYVVTGLF